LESALPPMPRLHPNLAELYRQKVINLAEALNEGTTRLEAAECIRELIEEIRLVPKRGELEIELFGELAALINLANGHPRSKGTGMQITLVAGTCNHRELTLPPVPI
jgi:site-specific DNA recombinase